DGPRHHDLHLVDGRNAVVDADHDAREIRGQENRRGDGECEIRAHHHQRQNDEDDGLGETRGPVFSRVRRSDSRGRKGRRNYFFASFLPVSVGDGLASSAASSSSSSSSSDFIVTLALSSKPSPPDVMTLSPSARPLRICTRLPSRIPTFTLRSCALLSAPKIMTFSPPSSELRIAEAGTRMVSRIRSARIEMRTVAPGLSSSPGLSAVTHTSTVVVVASTAG